ncbi:MAG TPA: DedA family protein [Solirubrobacteraceae bacterium]|nr:DedA family protein [Solirubrobacteraceae bacterium]
MQISLLPLLGAAGLATLVALRRGELGRGLVLAGLLGTAALTAWGLGLIAPPHPAAVIRTLVGGLGAWTYAIVGVLAFAETGAGVGLVAPGELAVVLGGVSAGQGEVALLPLIAIVWACAFAGDLLSFALGRRLGRDFLVRHGPRVGVTPPRLARVEVFFAAHGGKTILLGRFVGLVRALSPFLAGASGMPAKRFVPITGLAAGVWAATFSTLGYVFWPSLDRLLELTSQGSTAIALTLTAILAGGVLVRRARSARHARRRREALGESW